MAVHFRAKFISIARRVPVIDPTGITGITHCNSKLWYFTPLKNVHEKLEGNPSYFNLINPINDLLMYYFILWSQVITSEHFNGALNSLVPVYRNTEWNNLSQMS